MTGIGRRIAAAGAAAAGAAAAGVTLWALDRGLGLELGRFRELLPVSRSQGA